MPEGLAINKEELEEIESVFDNLYQKIKPKLTSEDDIHLKRAYEIALKGHNKQRRRSGEPYILHPLEVARICFEEIGLGPTAIISAILHDVVEDTAFTLEDISKKFTPKITKIVDGLTKLDGLYNVESPQAENFKKVISTLVEDVRVVLIKMADRIHNLRTIDHMPAHKKLKIAAETAYIYAPLAHRLGQYQIKTEFQDICLKITDEETFREIQFKLKETQKDRKLYIESFLKPLEKKLNELNVPYRVMGRPKAISSIYNKLKKKKVPFEEIYDLFAVRIIVDVAPDKEKSICWQVYSIITDFFNPIPERLKDWVTTPKGNGYESLHTTVIGPKGRYVEVQIRSERMDEIAEKGFAAHWKYKGVKSENNVFDKWLSNVREILDAQHSNALEFLNDFKTNLFNEEVYAFTPKGDMKILPKGATALDFAFEIHSDIGYHATAIKINNKLVPMGYKLKNGDQVSVTTQLTQKPKENWLKMVVTGKARSKIRSAMKEERRKKGELGRETLERKLRNLKVSFEENVDFLVKHYGFISRPDLYYAIFTESIKLTALKTFGIEGNKFFLKQEPSSDTATQQRESSPKKNVKKKTSRSKLLINGDPGELYDFVLSPCCNPVNGDPIFAYTNANNNLKIHRSNCPNATHLMAHFGYRILKADWAVNVESNYVVDLLINGVDSGIGVIQSLSQIISDDLGINIISFNIEGKEGVFEAKISIVIKNKDQLRNAVATIKKMNTISNVIRIDKSSKK